MKKSLVLLALLCAAFSALAQPAIISAKNLRATQKFTLDTANVTRITRTVNGSSLHSQLPTAKAVWDAIQTGSPVLSVNGLTGAVVLDLNLSGQTLSLTGDASTVTLPIVGVSAGTGVSVSTTAGVATVTNTGDLSTTNEIQTLSRNVATNNLVSLSLSGGSANVEDLFVEGTASFTPGSTTATMSGTLPVENAKLWVYRNGLPYVVGSNVLRSGSTLTFSRALASGEVVRFKYPFQ